MRDKLLQYEHSLKTSLAQLARIVNSRLRNEILTHAEFFHQSVSIPVVMLDSSVDDLDEKYCTAYHEKSIIG